MSTDIYGRRLYLATVLKAHQPLYVCIDMKVLILAEDLDKATTILHSSVNGWKRHREYSLEEADFETYHSLSKLQKRLLDQSGFLYLNDGG